MNTPFETNLSFKNGYITFGIGSQGIELQFGHNDDTPMIISRKELGDLVNMARYVWDNCNGVIKKVTEVEEIQDARE